MVWEDILTNLCHDQMARDMIISWVAAYKWFRHYEDRKSLEDDPWMRRPVVACNNEATLHVWESSERTRDIEAQHPQDHVSFIISTKSGWPVHHNTAPACQSLSTCIWPEWYHYASTSSILFTSRPC